MLSFGSCQELLVAQPPTTGTPAALRYFATAASAKLAMPTIASTLSWVTSLRAAAAALPGSPPSSTWMNSTCVPSMPSWAL